MNRNRLETRKHLGACLSWEIVAAGKLCPFFQPQFPCSVMGMGQSLQPLLAFIFSHEFQQGL